MKNVIILFIPFLLFLAGCGRGNEVITPQKGKNNLPPLIMSARVEPESPGAGMPLNVTVKASDPDGDRVSFHYRWFVNGHIIPGETEDTLNPQFFKKGDKVVVEVTPTDGENDGKVFLSSPVVIKNTIPEVLAVRLKPQLVYPGDRIVAEVEARDDDGDLISYIYEWQRNGRVVKGEDDEELITRGFKKKDIISVTITPFDGEDKGRSKRSLPIVLANRPPEITSFPPEEVSNGRYIYKVEAKDEDGDELTFSLDKSPSGMNIASASGLIEWEIPSGVKGDFQVRIVVSDGESKAFQGFQLSIE